MSSPSGVRAEPRPKTIVLVLKPAQNASRCTLCCILSYEHNDDERQRVLICKKKASKTYIGAAHFGGGTRHIGGSSPKGYLDKTLIQSPVLTHRAVFRICAAKIIYRW